MEIELTGILGRKADLQTAEDLSRYFRQKVLNSAEAQYAEGGSGTPAGMQKRMG